MDELFFSVVVGGWWLELRFVDDLVDGTQTALPRLVLVTARTGGVISGCFLEVLAVFGADNSQSCKLAFSSKIVWGKISPDDLILMALTFFFSSLGKS